MLAILDNLVNVLLSVSLSISNKAIAVKICCGSSPLPVGNPSLFLTIEKPAWVKPSMIRLCPNSAYLN